MKKFEVTTHGRQESAIGAFYDLAPILIDANNEDEARTKAIEQWRSKGYETHHMAVKEVPQLTLIANWDTLDQALGPESNDADIEAFVPAARVWASENGYKFDTIRNIQQSGFFFSSDGETQDNDYNDEANHAFEQIISRM